MAMVEPLPYGPASMVPMVIVCAITGVTANTSSIISESKLFVKVLFMENRRSGSVVAYQSIISKCEKVKRCKSAMQITINGILYGNGLPLVTKSTH